MEAMTVVALAAWFLMGIGLLVSRLPVGTCTECDHCRAVKARQDYERALDRDNDLKRLYGVGRCARCGQYHRIGGPC